MAETPASPAPAPSSGEPTTPPTASPTATPSASPEPPSPAAEVPPTPPASETPAPAAPPAATPPDAPAAPKAPDAPAPPLPVSPTGDTVPATPLASPPAAPVTTALDALDAVELGEPRVATTLEVPPLPAGFRGSLTTPARAAGPGAAEAAGSAEGGEWDLLVGKVTDWLEQNDLPGQWERLGGPLRGFGVFLGLLLVLKLYVALLDTLDDLPLLPRLLQLVGLIAVLRFSVLRLTRSSDRQAVLDDWKRRWDAFRGA